MKWILPVLMILIILPGLHYTGFINLFGESADLKTLKKIDSQISIHSPEITSTKPDRRKRWKRFFTKET